MATKKSASSNIHSHLLDKYHYGRPTQAPVKREAPKAPVEKAPVKKAATSKKLSFQEQLAALGGLK